MAAPYHSIFYRPDALTDAQLSVKALKATDVRLKPNSITLAGSELVRSWFEPDSVMNLALKN